MKIRLASSIALAGALALGLSGCGLITHQATTDAYAPSDGIELTVEGVALRNVLLITDETGENVNVVFSAVNRTGAPADLTISFSGEGAQQATAEIEIPEGVSNFGDPEGELAPVAISLPGVIPGATVDAYFEVDGSGQEQRRVPVLDGTLVEYEAFVLSGTATEEEPSAEEPELILEEEVAEDAAAEEEAATE